MHILLIGGTGFLGKTVASYLKGLGHHVVGTGFTQKGDVQLDLLDASSLEALLTKEKWEVVINFAGVLVPESESLSRAANHPEPYAVNEFGPEYLARTVAATGSHARLLHIASATEPEPLFPTPESAYSKAKSLGTRAFEKVVAECGLPAVVAVVHNAYGIGQNQRRFLAATIEKLKSQQPVTIEYPTRIRDFCLKEDVAVAIGSIIHSSKEGQLDQALRYLEIGTGVGTSLFDAAQTIAGILGADQDLIIPNKEVKVDVHPIRIAKVNPSSSTICRTQFPDGIQQVIAGYR